MRRRPITPFTPAAPRLRDHITWPQALGAAAFGIAAACGAKYLAAGFYIAWLLAGGQ